MKMSKLTVMTLTALILLTVVAQNPKIHPAMLKKTI